MLFIISLQKKFILFLLCFFRLSFFSLLLPGTFRQKSIVCFYTGLGVVFIAKFFLLLSIDGFFSAGMYANYKPVIDFMNEKAAHKKVYFFTTEVSNAFPNLLYSSASSASRFSHFWMLAGLVKHERLAGKAPEAKDYLIHLICEDIEKEAPSLILVDSSVQKNKFLVYLWQLIEQSSLFPKYGWFYPQVLHKHLTLDTLV